MTKTLNIPPTKEDELNIKEWLHFIEQNRYTPNDQNLKRLIIDFSEMDYIYTIQLVSLSALIEEYHLNEIIVVFENCSNTELENYLTDIKFFEYWNDGFDRKRYTAVGNKHCLCLWQLHSTMIDPYVNHAKDFAQRNWEEGKDFSILHSALAELFNNILDHSESNILGYSISQFHPTHQQLRISVCDFGIGIPESINRFMKATNEKPLSSEEAIKKAFELGFTVRSQPHNRGWGLDTLKSIVHEFEGNLTIYSNDVELIFQKEDLITNQIDDNIGGTIVDVLIDTKHLEDLENEYKDFEF